MKIFRTVLLAGAFGLALASTAGAQSYRDGDDIQITAPRFKLQSTHPTGPLEKVSLTTHVRYDDLNLRTRSGARELKVRVRDAAQETCMRVAEAYPIYQQAGTSCYKTALEDGELRANAAIRGVRDRATYASYED